MRVQSKKQGVSRLINLCILSRRAPVFPLFDVEPNSTESKVANSVRSQSIVWTMVCWIPCTESTLCNFRRIRRALRLDSGLEARGWGTSTSHMAVKLEMCRKQGRGKTSINNHPNGRKRPPQNSKMNGSIDHSARGFAVVRNYYSWSNSASWLMRIRGMQDPP